MSNTAAVDPRMRKPTDPRKRPPSHSPEPDRPQKQARPEAASPKDGSSRRSSLSNGTANHVGGPPGISRKPSTQLQADLRKEAERGVQSPASPVIGFASGDSTPQHLNGASVNKEPVTAPTSILGALQRFSSQVATQAALEIDQRHADQSYQQACTGYKNLKNNFKAFPALQEKQSAARQRAHATLQKAKQDFNTHVSIQNETMGSLAALISSAINARPEPETRTDNLSRDDLAAKHEAITTQYNRLSSSVNTVQTRLQDCETQSVDAKRTAQDAATKATTGLKDSKEALQTAAKAEESARITKSDTATLQKNFRDVKEDAGLALKRSRDADISSQNAERQARSANETANDALQRAKDAKTVSDQASQLHSKLEGVAKDVTRLYERNQKGEHGAPKNNKDTTDLADQVKSSIEDLRRELADFKTQAAAQFAQKKDHDEVETRLEDAVQELAGARKTNATIAKDIKELKSKETSSTNSAELDAESKLRLDQLWQDGPKLVDKVTGVEQKIAELQTLTTSDKDDAIKTLRHVGSLLDWITAHEETLEQLDKFKDSVEEPGKGTVIERFKKIDLAVNNLSTFIGGDNKTTLPQRITAVERMLGELRQGAKSASFNMFSSQTSLEEGEIRSQSEPYKEQGKLVTRVPELEQKYDVLRKELDDVKSSVRVDSPSGHSIQDSGLASRVQQLEETLQALVESQEEKDGILVEHIDTTVDQLKTAQGEASARGKEELDKVANTLKEAKVDFDRVEKSMQGKADLETVDQRLMGAVHPMRESIQKLQGEVSQLQAQKQKSAMPAPQTSPVFGHPTQLPNGVGSPHTNGPGPQRVPTPQTSGPPTQDMARMQAQIDGIVLAVQQLKGRYDNLATDEMVKAMAIQMTVMFPEAKNFSSAQQALAKRTDALETGVRDIRVVVNAINAGQMPGGELQKLQSRVDDLVKEQREVGRISNTMELKIVNLKNTTNTLAKAKIASPAAAPAPAPPGVSPAEFKALSGRVDDIGLNTQRMNELNAMADQVKKHTGRIDSLEWKQGGLEKDMKEFAQEVAKATASVQAMEEEGMKPS